MSKNIDVAAHVRRYEQTELTDVLKLVSALNELIELRKAQAIADLEEKLKLFKSGEVPAAEPKAEAAPKRTRGGKKLPEPEQEGA